MCHPPRTETRPPRLLLPPDHPARHSLTLRPRQPPRYPPPPPLPPGVDVPLGSFFDVRCAIDSEPRPVPRDASFPRITPSPHAIRIPSAEAALIPFMKS